VKKTFVTLSLAAMAAVLIVFVACSKTTSNGSSTSSNPNHIPPDRTVSASLQGRVVDENGIPVQGAVVTSGVATTSTDINGLFTFSNISMSSRFGYVKVVKQGYFMGSRSIITNAGASNYVNIQLIPRTVSGTFPAPSGGRVAVSAGDTAIFAASSVVEASSGAAYTGMVTVYASYLNPTDPNLYKYMPGDLRGIGSDGNETALQSFGMMDVEMQDASGNKLQLAPGQQATLTFAIPDSLVSVAPAAIPLWYFNDTTGRWIQQGAAVRQGNSYIGLVEHFTFWNCDAPMGTVNFKVSLKDQLGNPLPYTYIQFQSQYWGTRGGYTDSTGLAQGLIPKGQELLMQVVTECGGLMGGMNVGPALTDQDLGTVTITVTNAKLILKGTVVDCSNNPVDSGFVSVVVDGLSYAAVVNNGLFVLPINRCYSTNTQVRLTAVEYSPAQSGAVKSIEAADDTVNVGQLSVCGTQISQYIYLTVGGTPYNFINPPDSVYYRVQPQNIPSNEISGYATDGSGNNIVIYVNQLNATGSYPAFFSISAAGAGGIQNDNITVNVTGFGALNGYVTGTITGTAYDSISRQSLQVSGSLNVIRTQ
jgi:hypothetical protein